MGGSTSTQNVTARYLKKSKLQKLLKELFPEHKDFDIQVSQPAEPLSCYTMQSMQHPANQYGR